MVGRIIETLEDVAEGAAHLAAVEPRFARALELTGPLPLRRRAAGFETLFAAIVSQQVSTAAATAIWNRLEAIGATAPARLAAATDAELRAAGLSRQKIAYGRSIATIGLDFEALNALPDEAIVKELTRIKGIGRLDRRDLRHVLARPGRRLRPGRPGAAGRGAAALRAPGAAEGEGAARHEPRLVALAGGCRAAALGLLPGDQRPRGRAVACLRPSRGSRERAPDGPVGKGGAGRRRHAGSGAGIATELGAAGATVYVTGRSTRGRRSEYDRPETIEETAELVAAAGGQAVAVAVDHLDAEAVRDLVGRIRAEQGRLDLLVNDIWGGETLFEWNKPVWEHDLENGLRLLRLAIDTHLITAHHALPLLLERPGGLLVEVTDGTAAYNADHYRINPFYDLAKVAVNRMAWAHAQDLGPRGAASVSLTPGWLRSEMMLEAFGVSEANWRDATAKVPHFVISESPRFVGRAVAAMAADPDRARWNGRSLSSGELAAVYGFTDLDGSRPDAWRYMVEVQDAGKPADATGYR